MNILFKKASKGGVHIETYGYNILRKDIKKALCYKGVRLCSLGKSVLGRNLYLLRLGRGEKKVFLNGAHHGLESITSHFLMRFFISLARNQKDPSISRILRKTELFVLPMVNPDGVEIARNNLPKNPILRKMLTEANGGEDFSKRWQANARGVDLNHNYNALWEECQKIEREHGIFGPGPTRYGGAFPESEPESRAVAELSRRHRFSLSVAFHTQGEVIYWDFNSRGDKNHERIGKIMAKASGYALLKAEGIASCAGYKDYVVHEFGTPAYTVELGLGKNPLPPLDIGGIYPKGERLLFAALDGQGRKML